MLNRLKRLIPRNFRISLLQKKYKGDAFYCNCCKSDIKTFIPGNPSAEAVEKHEITGAGYHEFDVCPVCKASYRQRSVMVYLEAQQILKEKIKVLHVAPEPAFSYVFQKQKNITYICGDLEPERYWYYVKAQYINLLDINFPSDTFDLIVCNHVLEHIENDTEAMKELYRVLKPGGIAILQVPISWKLDSTFEDFNITSPEERLKAFGQQDHVRIYGGDYTERLEKCGFHTELFDPESVSALYGDKFEKLRLDPRDKIFVSTK